MHQVRANVFETNSSSTHSIAISKEPVNESTLPRVVYFNMDEFGWECGHADPADYLYTAIMCYADNPKMYLDKIKDTLDKFGINCEFGEVVTNQYGVENGYIDHGHEAFCMAASVVNNEDRLMRYLFGDTCVYTGNDNCACDCGNSKCCIAYDTYWDHDTHEELPNPYHDKEHYEYYYKGN